MSSLKTQNNADLSIQQPKSSQVDKSTQKGSIFALHEINTFANTFGSRGILHDEGGWPKDIDKLDMEQTARFRQKTERDERFGLVVGNLARKMEAIILQNNAIDIYQQYFPNVESQLNYHWYRTVAVFKDVNGRNCTVGSLSWSPNGGDKLAIAYFESDKSLLEQNAVSSIWQIDNSNQPDQVLETISSIVRLEYHPKDVNYLAAGLYNGQVAFFDLRTHNEPVELTSYDESHRDPVYNLLWSTSKTGLEFFTATTDGFCKWWDARKLNTPIETLILDFVRNEKPIISRALGAMCIEYDPAVATRFSIGTVEGYILMGNRKGKLATEKITNRLKAHLGQIKAIERSPIFTKVFLSIGNWTFRIWSEDCVESPIMWSYYYQTSLTGGCWSPTRYSTFFIIRKDGFLDCWDILQNQKSPFLQIKVSDDCLHAIRAHESGRLLAIGDSQGNTYLIELNEYLSRSEKNDRNLLTAMIECEVKREKILQSRIRELRVRKQTESNKHEAAISDDNESTPSTTGGVHFDHVEIEHIRNEFQSLVVSKDSFTQFRESEIIRLRSQTLDRNQSPDNGNDSDSDSNNDNDNDNYDSGKSSEPHPESEK